MVRREKVAGESGRQWMSGDITSSEYFRRARIAARETAEKSVADRMRRLTKSMFASDSR